MESRKRTRDQLKKELRQKLFIIKSDFDKAIEYDFESDARIAYSNIIASSLRAIVFGDKKNEYKSLFHRVEYDKKNFLPCL